MNIQTAVKVTSLFVAVGTVGIFLSACSGYGNQSTTPQTNQNAGGNTTSPAAANAVTIQNMGFSPSNVTVKVGQAVTWTNQDPVAHTVTSDTGAFDSGSMASGKTYSFTFTKAGTFPYHCSVHPSMTGQVTVTN